MKSLLVLGRQPEIGMAELESLYGAAKLCPVGDKTVIVDVDPCLLAFDRLGGSLKFCKILTTLDTASWSKIEKFLMDVSPDQSKAMPEGKMKLGFSAIGLDVDARQLQKSGLKLKKAIAKTGRSVRVIPNNELELNSAQVIHNKLTSPTGWELVFIKDGQQTIIAQTVKEQDIESYTKRDRGRPKRDLKVGMLPPKLAQIIINLAVGQLPEDKLESICDIPPGQKIPRPNMGQTILDPFCGTGVIPQEAYLMGYGIYGTDIEKRMIDSTRENLDWLVDNLHLDPVSPRLQVADATEYKWADRFDFVASETYLGPPFTSAPSSEVLAQTMANCNMIIRKFLQNIQLQVKPGTRFCVAVPAWQTGHGEFRHLPLIDQIEELGYNVVSFEHAGKGLMYFRPDQIVARQLLVITRK